MDLMTLLGDAYKENMTLDEVNAALAGRDMIDRSELTANYVSKKLFDKTASQLAEAKRQNGAQRTAADDLTAQLQERIATLENENKEAKRNASIAATKASLIAQGYDDALAAETATAMADNDMAKVLLNQGKYLAAREQAMKDELLKNTRPPAAGGNPSGAPVDFTKAKADALASGDDAAYMRLCREEMEQAAKK